MADPESTSLLRQGGDDQGESSSTPATTKTRAGPAVEGTYIAVASTFGVMLMLAIVFRFATSLAPALTVPPLNVKYNTYANATTSPIVDTPETNFGVDIMIWAALGVKMLQYTMECIMLPCLPEFRRSWFSKRVNWFRIITNVFVVPAMTLAVATLCNIVDSMAWLMTIVITLNSQILYALGEVLLSFHKDRAAKVVKGTVWDQVAAWAGYASNWIFLYIIIGWGYLKGDSHIGVLLVWVGQASVNMGQSLVQLIRIAEPRHKCCVTALKRWEPLEVVNSLLDWAFFLPMFLYLVADGPRPQFRA